MFWSAGGPQKEPVDMKQSSCQWHPCSNFYIPKSHFLQQVSLLKQQKLGFTCLALGMLSALDIFMTPKMPYQINHGYPWIEGLTKRIWLTGVSGAFDCFQPNAPDPQRPRIAHELPSTSELWTAVHRGGVVLQQPSFSGRRLR